MKKVLLTEREYQALSKLRHDNERGLNESANDITSFIKRGLKSVMSRCQDDRKASVDEGGYSDDGYMFIVKGKSDGAGYSDDAHGDAQSEDEDNLNKRNKVHPLSDTPYNEDVNSGSIMGPVEYKYIKDHVFNDKEAKYLGELCNIVNDKFGTNYKFVNYEEDGDYLCMFEDKDE